MKLVSHEVHTAFVQELNDVHGVEVGGVVESVVQTIDDSGVIRAQVIFFEGDDEPQYMIDKRVAWNQTLRAAQARLNEREVVVGSFLPASAGVLIDG